MTPVKHERDKNLENMEYNLIFPSCNSKMKVIIITMTGGLFYEK